MTTRDLDTRPERFVRSVGFIVVAVSLAADWIGVGSGYPGIGRAQIAGVVIGAVVMLSTSHRLAEWWTIHGAAIVGSLRRFAAPVVGVALVGVSLFADQMGIGSGEPGIGRGQVFGALVGVAVVVASRRRVRQWLATAATVVAEKGGPTLVGLLVIGLTLAEAWLTFNTATRDGCCYYLGSDYPLNAVFGLRHALGVMIGAAIMASGSRTIRRWFTTHRVVAGLISIAVVVAVVALVDPLVCSNCLDPSRPHGAGCGRVENPIVRGWSGAEVGCNL